MFPLSLLRPFSSPLSCHRRHLLPLFRPSSLFVSTMSRRFRHKWIHNYITSLPSFIIRNLLVFCLNESNGVEIRGVQNRTNPIEKPQIETAKNRIWFGCIQIIFLLNRMIWFGLRFLSYQPNQSKSNRNIRKNTN